MAPNQSHGPPFLTFSNTRTPDKAFNGFGSFFTKTLVPGWVTDIGPEFTSDSSLFWSLGGFYSNPGEGR